MAGGNASCGINYFCIGAFLIFVGSVLVCALGFTIVLPYAATRNWPEVTCEVINTSYNFLQCMCDQQIYEEDLGCITKYPCLEVLIQYRINKSLIINMTGLNLVTSYHNVNAEVTTVSRQPRQTFDDDVPGSVDVLNDKDSMINYSHIKTGRDRDDPEANLVDKYETGTKSSDDVWLTEARRTNVDPRSTLPYSGSAMTSRPNAVDDVKRAEMTEDTCSLHECGVEEWNVKEAARFKSAWGLIGKSYPCYYRPDSPNIVILSKTPVLVVIHAIVWPSLSLIGGCLLWLGLCTGCCSLDNGETYTPDHYR
ncbi:hypothetical protein LSH36_119g06026 [Paralvinella palmiformis]|uniref:Uncharacterized protein n=1 Tax=Paralvinella palmiformis TaxID=53620 RepID=A0AAD9JXP4_9ANNE|nr:hypothetical protein LSH36_119g06026 [Paralvinella palmiformis]